MRTFEKVSNPSLRGLIAERIRQAILDGRLAEGERLVERKLAQEFGASLTAVREALVELESDGFIAKLPNSATHVVRLSVEDAEKIVSVREVLEGYAVSEAARNAGPAEMQCLVTLWGEIITAAQSGDLRRVLQKDLALHETIWQIARNEPLVASLRRIVLVFYAFLAIRLRELANQELVECAESNLPLLSGIYSKDPDMARAGLGYSLGKWFAKARLAVTPANQQRQEAGVLSWPVKSLALKAGG